MGRIGLNSKSVGKSRLRGGKFHVLKKFTTLIVLTLPHR
nr:MAG TPA: hypothetical protein [Caudoviricetes sp.]